MIFGLIIYNIEMQMYKVLPIAVFLLIMQHSSCQPTFSDNCLDYNQNYSTCIACRPGFYLEYFLCIVCAPLCNCNRDNYCTSCIQLDYKNTIYKLNSYYEGSNNRCYLCNEAIQNCLSCSSLSFCDRCYGGYFPVSTTAANGTSISTCSPQLCQMNSTTNATRCQICLNSNQCQLCAIGYYLDANTNICSLSQCLLNCFECNSSTTCKICVDEYYLQTNTNPNSQACLPCTLFNCLICHNSTFCDKCQTGNLLDIKSGQCSNGTGISNCVLYSQQFSTCNICQPGYFALTGSCNQCVGCDLCGLQFICWSKCQNSTSPFNYACLSSLYERALTLGWMICGLILYMSVQI